MNERTNERTNKLSHAPNRGPYRQCHDHFMKDVLPEMKSASPVAYVNMASNKLKCDHVRHKPDHNLVEKSKTTKNKPEYINRAAVRQLPL